MMKRILASLLLALTLFSVSVNAADNKKKEEHVPLTPEGNLTLVDDITQGDQQFLTVQSKSGAYFYIVIDRAGSAQNVYFLNKVDESDLMELTDGKIPGLKPDGQNVPGHLPDEPQDQEDSKDEKRQKVFTRGAVLLTIFASCGAAMFFYYKKKTGSGLPGFPKKQDNKQADSGGKMRKDKDDDYENASSFEVPNDNGSEEEEIVRGSELQNEKKDEASRQNSSGKSKGKGRYR